jgi:thioredoxin-like negative regulator of GroEL
VAESLHGVVRVAAVNCDEQKALCQGQGVQGYPTIKAYKQGRWIDYHGDRSAGSIKDWGIGLLPTETVSVLSSDASLGPFLKSSQQSKIARWGVGVILFSSKDKTSPLYKSLSMRYKGRIAFAEIRKGSSLAADGRFRINQYPTLIAVCGGDERSIIPFSGDLKNSQLVKWLNAFYSGKKCADAIQIDDNTDFSKMKVSQLKQLLGAKDVKCENCVEKSDFVRRVKEVYNVSK